MLLRIRDLRVDSDLSQACIASKLNCSQQVYSNYELGQREIPLDLLSKLADFYGTSVDYLMRRTDCKRPYPKSTKGAEK